MKNVELRSGTNAKITKQGIMYVKTLFLRACMKANAPVMPNRGTHAAFDAQRVS